MDKLQSLRDAVINSPLKIKAKNLLTFAEKGTVLALRGEDGANAAFQVRYTAHLIVTDATFAPQDLFFIALLWLHGACPGAAEDAIRFHVDIIDSEKADISLAVDITEIIAAVPEANGTRLVPAADPNVPDIDMANFFPTLPDAPPQ